MSAQQKARLGFIGAGWWATSNHMPVLRGARMSSWWVSAAWELKNCGRCKRLSGLPTRLKIIMTCLISGELDGVVVASPHTLHHEQPRAALKRVYTSCVRNP